MSEQMSPEITVVESVENYVKRLRSGNDEDKEGFLEKGGWKILGNWIQQSHASENKNVLHSIFHLLLEVPIRCLEKVLQDQENPLISVLDEITKQEMAKNQGRKNGETIWLCALLLQQWKRLLIHTQEELQSEDDRGKFVNPSKADKSEEDAGTRTNKEEEQETETTSETEMKKETSPPSSPPKRNRHSRRRPIEEIQRARDEQKQISLKLEEAIQREKERVKERTVSQTKEYKQEGLFGKKRRIIGVDEGSGDVQYVAEEKEKEKEENVAQGEEKVHPEGRKRLHAGTSRVDGILKLMEKTPMPMYPQRKVAKILPSPTQVQLPTNKQEEVNQKEKKDTRENVIPLKSNEIPKSSLQIPSWKVYKIIVPPRSALLRRSRQLVSREKEIQEEREGHTYHLPAAIFYAIDSPTEPDLEADRRPTRGQLQPIARIPVKDVKHKTRIFDRSLKLWPQPKKEKRNKKREKKQNKNISDSHELVDLTKSPPIHITPDEKKEHSNTAKKQEYSNPAKKQEYVNQINPPKKQDNSNPPKKQENSNPPKKLENSNPPKKQEYSNPPEKQDYSNRGKFNFVRIPDLPKLPPILVTPAPHVSTPPKRVEIYPPHDSVKVFPPLPLPSFKQTTPPLPSPQQSNPPLLPPLPSPQQSNPPPLPPLPRPQQSNLPPYFSYQEEPEPLPPGTVERPTSPCLRPPLLSQSTASIPSTPLTPTSASAMPLLEMFASLQPPPLPPIHTQQIKTPLQSHLPPIQRSNPQQIAKPPQSPPASIPEAISEPSHQKITPRQTILPPIPQVHRHPAAPPPQVHRHPAAPPPQVHRPPVAPRPQVHRPQYPTHRRRKRRPPLLSVPSLMSIQIPGHGASPCPPDRPISHSSVYPEPSYPPNRPVSRTESSYSPPYIPNSWNVSPWSPQPERPFHVEPQFHHQQLPGPRSGWYRF